MCFGIDDAIEAAVAAAVTAAAADAGASAAAAGTIAAIASTITGAAVTGIEAFAVVTVADCLLGPVGGEVAGGLFSVFSLGTSLAALGANAADAASGLIPVSELPAGVTEGSTDILDAAPTVDATTAQAPVQTLSSLEGEDFEQGLTEHLLNGLHGVPSMGDQLSALSPADLVNANYVTPFDVPPEVTSDPGFLLTNTGTTTLGIAGSDPTIVTVDPDVVAGDQHFITDWSTAPSEAPGEAPVQYSLGPSTVNPQGNLEVPITVNQPPAPPTFASPAFDPGTGIVTTEPVTIVGYNPPGPGIAADAPAPTPPPANAPGVDIPTDGPTDDNAGLGQGPTPASKPTGTGPAAPRATPSPSAPGSRSLETFYLPPTFPDIPPATPPPQRILPPRDAAGNFIVTKPAPLTPEGGLDFAAAGLPEPPPPGQPPDPDEGAGGAGGGRRTGPFEHTRYGGGTEGSPQATSTTTAAARQQAADVMQAIFFLATAKYVPPSIQKAAAVYTIAQAKDENDPNLPLGVLGLAASGLGTTPVRAAAADDAEGLLLAAKGPRPPGGGFPQIDSAKMEKLKAYLEGQGVRFAPDEEAAAVLNAAGEIGAVEGAPLEGPRIARTPGEAIRQIRVVNTENPVGYQPPRQPGSRTVNCVACARATDATLAGNPATAIPKPTGAQWFSPWLEGEFGSTFEPVPSYDAIRSTMAARGPGARAIVLGERAPTVDYFGRAVPTPGHVFNVINIEGEVVFVDGQTGRAAHLENFSGLKLLFTN